MPALEGLPSALEAASMGMVPGVRWGFLGLAVAMLLLGPRAGPWQVTLSVWLAGAIAGATLACTQAWGLASPLLVTGAACLGAWVTGAAEMVALRLGLALGGGVVGMLWGIALGATWTPAPAVGVIPGAVLGAVLLPWVFETFPAAMVPFAMAPIVAFGVGDPLSVVVILGAWGAGAIVHVLQIPPTWGAGSPRG